MKMKNKQDRFTYFKKGNTCIRVPKQETESYKQKGWKPITRLEYRRSILRYF